MSDKIHVNYRTALKNITGFGFDLDDTILVYKPKAFELRYKLVSKILAKRDPRFSFLLEQEYDPLFMIRGLVIDKKLGTILKLNLRKQVDIAMRGKTKLSLDEKDSIYHSPITLDETYNGRPRYKVLDSFNYVVDAFIYSSIIEQYKNYYSLVEHDRNFILFNELHKAVESIHDPDSRLFLNEVMKNFEDYISTDQDCGRLKHLLKKIRSYKKKTFLITNSGESYTIHVLKYLIGENFCEYFDEIIVDAMKPKFFTSEERFLKGNNDFIRRCGSFAELLSKHPDISPNTFIYIGDHFKGDVLAGNRKRGILPVAIVPEISKDIEIEPEHSIINSNICELGARIDSLKLEMENVSDLSVQKIFAEAIEARKKEIIELKKKRFKISNKYWGSPFICGSESTLFADQIKTYTNFYISHLLALENLDFEKKLLPKYIEKMPHQR